MKLNKTAWLCILVALCVSAGLLFVSLPSMRSFEESALDLMFKNEHIPERELPVAIVMVDEHAYEKQFGYYDPLPRRYLAQLIDTLSAKGAKTIALDIAFYDKLDQLDPKGDSILWRAMKKANNVIAVSIFHPREDRSERMQLPHPFFMGALKGVGFANLLISGGGGLASVREVWPIRKMSDGQTFISFSSMMYCQMMDIPPQNFIDEVQSGKFELVPKITMSDSGLMIIHYESEPSVWVKQDDGLWTQTSPSLITTYRSSQLTGDISWPEDFLKDKLIVVGNGSEFVPDRFVTPFYRTSQKNLMYGAEVHANAFLTLLNKNFIDRMPFLTLLAILLFVSTIMVISTVRFGFIGELSTLFGLLILSLVTSYLFFKDGIWMPVISVIVTLGLSYFLTSIYQAFTEERNKKQIKSMFARYAPPAYVDQLANDPSKLELGGEEKEISILFSDIEGFTSISEKLPPKELVELLNNYLDKMTKMIFNQGGTLDKYIGDAIVAVFGAPLPLNEHALHACYAALDMQKSLAEFREKWTALGLPSVRNRIGVNTGKVVFGNIGSDIRYDYTGIGDNMNLASRLEAANKQYGTYIMISDFTYQQVRERVIVRDLDLIVVKGKTKPVKVYELLGRSNEPLPQDLRLMTEHYQEGIDKYLAREWEAAIKKFEQALGHVHNDEPSKIYIQRCKNFITTPPPADWDGTFHLTEK